MAMRRIEVTLMSGEVCTLEVQPKMRLQEFKEALKAGFRMKHETAKSNLFKDRFGKELMKILQLKRSQKHEVDFVPEMSLGKDSASTQKQSGPSRPLTPTSPMLVRFSIHLRMRWYEDSAMWRSLLMVRHLPFSFSKSQHVTRNGSVKMWSVKSFLLLFVSVQCYWDVLPNYAWLFKRNQKP